ncbi:PEP-CTERM sorting domain-containing protein [Chamaesiphon sp. GL140_3_metabinner_50]|uniref:PEP-CTERM sorting domain-containing protein n=1 Tax=Chamaesiphon sp. GL140_3_metabinner_50 TaxID=2970812 RepID=UPI0025ECFC57|nr:PEP-CTERM sorting domain-containing protein [Chamaesiphon sp. GL140_3_metabinner_50]
MKISITSHRIGLSLCTATVASLSLLGLSRSAQAATVQFTDLASFQANTTGLTTIGFEGLAPTGNFTNYTGSGLTINGVTFIDSFGLFVVDPLFAPSAYDWGSGAVLLGSTNFTSLTTTLTATLPSGVTAVGSDIMSFDNYASPFVITLSTGETFNVNSLNYPNRQFVGFTTDTAIASISFQATSGNKELDNFRFGTASAVAVPEPFTIIGTLVGGTAVLRMRKKLKAAGK